MSAPLSRVTLGLALVLFRKLHTLHSTVSGLPGSTSQTRALHPIFCSWPQAAFVLPLPPRRHLDSSVPSCTWVTDYSPLACLTPGGPKLPCPSWGQSQGLLNLPLIAQKQKLNLCDSAPPNPPREPGLFHQEPAPTQRIPSKQRSYIEATLLPGNCRFKTTSWT